MGRPKPSGGKGRPLKFVDCDRLQEVANGNDAYKRTRFCDPQVAGPMCIHQISSLGDGAVPLDTDDRTISARFAGSGREREDPKWPKPQGAEYRCEAQGRTGS